MNKSIFKAYDIRGIYGQDMDDADVRMIGRAIFEYLKPKRVAVGRDARLSAPEVQENLSQALAACGVEVIDLGMVSTDMTIYAAGALDFDLAISVTASHNPKEWIGMKIQKRGGGPVGGDGELEEIGKIAMSMGPIEIPVETYTFEKLDILDAWINHVIGFVDVAKIKPLKVVIDASNGVAGPIVERLAEKLPIQIVPLYFDPDGNFPNHLPSPIEPENVRDLQAKVLEVGADLGVAFDGDADRMFLIDERGGVVTGSETTALVMEAMLSDNPEQTVLYNAICGWNVRDVLAKFPEARSHKTKVGHSNIKKDMRTYDAVFAGEHSGHYFFKENFCGDSALITMVFVLELISVKDAPVTEILAEYRKYVQIPEVNFTVANKDLVIAEIAAKYSGGKEDWLDGVTIEYEDWWLNVRPSNTEPLLRLNIEAKTPELLAEKFGELSELIKSLAQVESLPLAE